jgi:hypothetical protein
VCMCVYAFRLFVPLCGVKARPVLVVLRVGGCWGDGEDVLGHGCCRCAGERGVGPLNLDMVRIANSLGCAAKLPGSGGTRPRTILSSPPPMCHPPHTP